MGDTWTTAAEHHTATADKRKSLPLAWRRRADLTGKLVIAASTVSQGFLFKSSIPCIRRPRRQPCAGVIHFRAFEEPEEIRWFCTKCDDIGTISDWKKTIDDFRSIHGRANIRLEPLCELFVTEVEFRSLIKLHAPIEKVLRYKTENGHMILGTIDEMEPLMGVVANARTQTKDPKTKESLLDLFERIEEDIGMSKELAKELGNDMRPN